MDTEKVVAELYNLIRDLNEKVGQVDKNVTSQIGGLDKKLTEVCITLKEREKQCTQHQAQMSDHEKRIRDLEHTAAAAADVIKSAPVREGRIQGLETWMASQEGVAGFLWKVGPITISAAALGFALYKGGH